MKSEAKVSSSDYTFGHDPEEIRRLETQGRLLAPLTRDVLRHAGITPGMRVLDVGCGAGDMAFAVVDLVGPTGEVIGFDRADAALSLARARAQAQGLTNVRFVQCDIDHAADLVAHGPFDAVVSRAVLSHLPNSPEALRKLLPLARPGGVVAFMEPEGTSGLVGCWSSPSVTILEEMKSVGLECLERGLMRADALSVIVAAFDEAGIAERRVTRTSMVNSARDDDACALVADMARTLHGIAQRMGLPLPSYDPKTVAVDFKRELVSKNALFSPPQWLAATGRQPAVRDPRPS